ncbi:MAG: glycosyltransferase family 39 protein, partial [Chloroflexota bacterium]|nr:glycosyltransferase family 39 protein [Chloroflexota bacterium]
PVPYESMQPPLFYLAAGLASSPFSPSPEVLLYISRLVAALFGVGTVYFIWAATRQILPAQPGLALLTALCVALLPQFGWNSGMVTNDSALNFTSALTVYAWCRGIRQPTYDPWLVKAGLAFGLAILAKLTALALVPAFLLVIWVRARDPEGLSGRLFSPAIMRRMFSYSLVAGVSVLAVTGWWLVRNLITYGEISGALNAFRYNAYSGVGGVYTESPPSLNQFLFDAFTSFIGRFSWFGVSDILLPTWLYTLWRLTIVGLVIGFAVFLLRRRGQTWRLKERISSPAFAMLLMLLVCTASIALSFIQFNTQVAHQPQGRYLFPLLLPLALAFNGSVYLFTRGLPNAVRQWCRLLPLGLVGLTYLVAITVFVQQRSI